MKRFVFAFLTFFFAFFSFSQSRPIVSDIAASSSNEKNISVFWELPKNAEPKINELLLYRKTKPINSFFDISSLQPLVSLKPTESFYFDTVNDFSDYYYAVVAKTEKGLYDVIVPSMNSTTSATHAKVPKLSNEAKSTLSANEKFFISEESRATPLPFLDLLENQNRQTIEMGENAHQIALELAKSYQPRQNIIYEPYIFEDDLVSPEGGDDFLLFDVLRTTFIQKKYKEAAEKLEQLIKTNISKSVLTRATFYLGESYYFSKLYDSSTLTFLKIYDIYPTLSKRWIDSSLDLFVK